MQQANHKEASDGKFIKTRQTIARALALYCQVQNSAFLFVIFACDKLREFLWILIKDLRNTRKNKEKATAVHDTSSEVWHDEKEACVYYFPPPTLSPLRVAVVFVAVYNFHVMIYLTAHAARRTNHSLLLLQYVAWSTTTAIVQLGHDCTDKCSRSTTTRGRLREYEFNYSLKQD